MKCDFCDVKEPPIMEGIDLNRTCEDCEHRLSMALYAVTGRFPYCYKAVVAEPRGVVIEARIFDDDEGSTWDLWGPF